MLMHQKYFICVGIEAFSTMHVSNYKNQPMG